MSKKRCTFLATIVLWLWTPCVAQEANLRLIPFEQGEKWGFINDKGLVAIKPQYDKAEPFSEGLALVEVSQKYGFIDSHGKFAIEPQYYIAFSFSEGLAAVTRVSPGTWGYIDHKGNTVIPPRFDWAGRFAGGMAEILLAPDPKAPNIDKNGFIDKTGSVVIEPKYGWAESFSEGLALIAEDKPDSNAYFNRKAFIDNKGKRVTEFFKNAESFSEGLAAVEVNSLWGFVDKTGAIVIAPAYDFVLRSFADGYAAVHCDNDRIAFIDRTGKKLSECIFEETWGFEEGLAAVQTIDGKWGFMDTKGRLAIKPQFDYADSFLNGLAKVRITKDNSIYEGYINHRGDYVIRPVKKRLRDDRGRN